MTEPDRGQLGTVRNATLLLDLLGDGPAHQQLSDLAERSGLTLPTVHRLLRSLVVAGLASQDAASSRYSLGPELVRLGERYLSRLPVLQAVSPYLVELRNATKATVLVALLVRGCVVYVDRIDGEDVGDIYREAHRVNDAFATAAGQVLVSRAADDEWAAACARAGERPRPSAAQRRRWRSAGHVVAEFGDLGHSLEVAVPIASANGGTLAALSATGKPNVLTEEAIDADVAPRLQRAAKAITRTLGHG